MPIEPIPLSYLSITTYSKVVTMAIAVCNGRCRECNGIMQCSDLLDALPLGLIVLDAEGRITGFNRTISSISGIPAAEALGQPLPTVFPPESCRCATTLAQMIDSGDQIDELPGVFQHRSGARVAVHLSAQRLPDQGLVISLREVAAAQARAEEVSGELAGIVSKSPAVQRILDVLPNIADSISTVLVLGESGTGKELFARAIHTLSPRRNKPFVAVNCGALPENLLESELFGHRAGAFTDAKQDRPGRFARAESGTLFLDEIGDLPLSVQVKLLRVLQEREYEPLGGTETVSTDVRVLCATNRDLATEVQSGRFRADLYYRINIVELRLPSLRERIQDIPLLVQRFLVQFNKRSGRHVGSISQDALRRLMNYNFPGNIRELENIIEHAYVLCPHEEIQEACLPDAVLGRANACATITDAGPPSPPSLPAAAFGDDEPSRIRAALAHHQGHRKRTAAALGIDPSTLWRKMKRYGLG